MIPFSGNFITIYFSKLVHEYVMKMEIVVVISLEKDLELQKLDR